MVTVYALGDIMDMQLPKRILKYVLIYCSAGKINMVVDENEFQLTADEVLTITSGQIHTVRSMENAKGFVLEFTFDFFCKNDNDIELIFHNGLFCHFAMNEIIPVEKSVIEKELLQIKEELQTQPYQYLISIHSRIELILVSVNRAKVKRGDEIWKPDALFLKFLELVRNNFEYNYPLDHFAKVLRTTVLKLNELAKQHAGKTAQHVIYGLIVSEAKRLLLYESFSVKEVAYNLGFNDPFYFSNFFKKHTGSPPSAYQKKIAP